MKLLQKRSTREKILLGVLVLSLALSAYTSIRVKALNVHIQRLKADIEQEQEEFSKLLQETRDAKPSHILEKEIAELERQLEEERQSLKGLKLSFVDLDDQEALLALIKGITEAAERHRLLVLSKENEIGELASMVGPLPGQSAPVAATSGTGDAAGKAHTVTDSALKRHVFKLRVRGTFASTYAFIRALHDMERSVLIIRIRLTADDLNTFNGLRLINTDLTLAI